MGVRVKQWQCPICGTWIHDAWGRHPHFKNVSPGLAAFTAMREAEEAGLKGVAGDAFARESEITNYWRTGNEPTREIDQ